MVGESIKREKVDLKKTLGTSSIMFIAIASVLGSGIFLLPAIGAEMSGPASIIAWLLLFFMFFYVAMCFGELSAMFPTAGGVYEYGKQAYGRFPSFIIGWIAWLIGNITAAMLIVAAIKILLPAETGTISLGITSISLPVFKFALSFFWIIAFNFMAYRGLKTSTIMLVTFATIALTVITSVILSGFIHFDISNLSPFFIYKTPWENISALVITVFLMAETFFGLESVLFLAGETKEPEKVMPKALMSAITIVGILALLVAISSLGAVNWHTYSSIHLPEMQMIGNAFGAGAAAFVPIAIYVVILGAAASWIVTSPRLLLALAEDRLFLEQFKDLHPEYSTPYKAIIFQAIATSIFLLVGSQGSGYTTLLRLLTPIVLLELIIVIFAVLALRLKKPEQHRPFRAPFAKTGSVIIVMILILLITVWASHEEGALGTLRLGISFIAVGFPLYLLIEIYYDPKMITEVNDIFAYFSLLTERLVFTELHRKEVLTLLGNIRGRTILEYGCNVGTFTLPLAEAVGPMGRIYAVDMSKNHIKITQRRYERVIWMSEELRHGKVHTIHDEMQLQRVHPNVYYADAVVSVGMLSYIQDTKKVLKDMHRILPVNGKIVFVEFADYFKVLPNVPWLNDNDTIEKVFREAGFSVRVIRKEGNFWNYVYVYGIKSNEDVPFI
jgi:amino acid transporter